MHIYCCQNPTATRAQKGALDSLETALKKMPANFWQAIAQSLQDWMAAPYKDPPPSKHSPQTDTLQNAVSLQTSIG